MSTTAPTNTAEAKPKTAPAKADYIVTHPREILGVHRAEGEAVALFPAQAKYYLAPLGTGLSVSAKKPEPTAKPTAGKE